MEVIFTLQSGRAKRETAKGRNRTRNAHFRRFLQIFADSLCKSRDLGVADLRRKPQIFAGNRRKPQIFAETGFSHLLSPFWRAPKYQKILRLLLETRSCRRSLEQHPCEPRPRSDFEPLLIRFRAGFDPSHLRPVRTKPVGRIFEIRDSNPTRRKCGRSLSPQKSKGLRRFRRAKNPENAENADTKTRKMQKMRLTGFNVTGFR